MQHSYQLSLGCLCASSLSRVEETLQSYHHFPYKWFFLTNLFPTQKNKVAKNIPVSYQMGPHTQQIIVDDLSSARQG